MSNPEFPMLSLVIFFPILGAIVISLLRNSALVKTCTVLFACLELLFSLLVVRAFDENVAGFQLMERYSWIPSLNIEYLVGIDGISVLFLPLSALLTLIAILASWNSEKRSVNSNFALFLVLQGITAGIFCALDMVLFLLFWELTLPPLFFLIGLWGVGSHRRGAAMKYTLFMLFAGVPLLLAIVLLGVNHATQSGGDVATNLAFSLPVLLEVPLADHLQMVVFFLLLLGFSVKVPLAPLHTWLPTIAMEGPAHAVALLTGLKLGVYGILRFALPLAPAAALEYSWVLSTLGAITLIYGALIALQQSNFRRLLAYASLSHVGMVMIAIATLNIQGIQGALFQLFNFTFVAGSLMLIAGFIHRRLGSTDVIHLGGMAKVMPRLTCLFFLFVLASIGVPGTSGFPAELLMIIGVLSNNIGLGLVALIGAVLGAAYMLTFTRRAFFGPIVRQDVAHIKDLQLREFILLSLPAILVLGFGFFPDSILDFNKVSSEAWLLRFSNLVP